MRKVIASIYVTLDGFIARSNGEFDWGIGDEQMEKDNDDLLSTADAILLGRETYQILANYWPTATRQDAILAAKMNRIPKIVFTKTLDKVEWGIWNNARLVKDHIAEEVARLKQQPGKNMVIFGSGSIISTLARAGLIDEYRLLVNPIVLGSGKPLFRDITGPIKLTLLQANRYQSGVVLLVYKPAD